MAVDEKDWEARPGLYAVLETSRGRIVCRLFEEQAPQSVANFVGLATGSKEYTDPRDGKRKKDPYFDGVLFHRVIPGFMIQTGDPTGTGRGGPGYKFQDEFGSGLGFDRPGRLGMANAGPGTNGSQFFITTVPTPHLDGHHTVFGQVVDGQAVAEQISQAKRDGSDRPLDALKIVKVAIKRVDGGGKAK